MVQYRYCTYVGPEHKLFYVHTLLLYYYVVGHITGTHIVCPIEMDL